MRRTRNVDVLFFRVHGHRMLQKAPWGTSNCKDAMAAATTLNAQLQGAMEHLGTRAIGPSTAYLSAPAPPVYAAPQPRFAAASRLTDSVYGDPSNNLHQLFTVQSGATAKPATSKPKAADNKPKKSSWWIFGIVLIALVVIGIVVVVITRMQAKKQQAKDLAEMQRLEAEKATALREAEAAESAAQQQRAYAQAEAAAAAEIASRQAQAAAVARARAAAAAVARANEGAAAIKPTLIVTAAAPAAPKPSPRVEQVFDDDTSSLPVQDDSLDAVHARIEAGISTLSTGIAGASASPAEN